MSLIVFYSYCNTLKMETVVCPVDGTSIFFTVIILKVFSFSFKYEKRSDLKMNNVFHNLTHEA